MFVFTTPVEAVDVFGRPANVNVDPDTAPRTSVTVITRSFASNPIVIAKAISRAVNARRPAARYVAPRSTYFVIWMNAILPQRMWDWAMRKVGRLDAKTLDLGAVDARPAAQPFPVSSVSARPAADARATAN